jgi:hypothetical protein
MEEKMLKKLIRNRKGTAEVIGTIMFIVILMFFFTNVYLWHDAATKDANDLFLKKINSTFRIDKISEASIQVTADGKDIILSRLWIIDTYGRHLYADLDVPVAAHTSLIIQLSDYTYFYTDQYGDSINAPYSSGLARECTVINTLGIQPDYVHLS